jgi:hypothetical protein
LYGFIRASSEAPGGPTWPDAREDAIARMKLIDATRTRP